MVPLTAVAMISSPLVLARNVMVGTRVVSPALRQVNSRLAIIVVPVGPSNTAAKSVGPTVSYNLTKNGASKV